MKILVIGGGGREHALVWKLRQSPSVTKIWCTPGNGGIAQDAECIAADPNDVAALAQLAEKLGTDLTVVGPEGPLVLGIADEFARRGLRLIGPSKECARLEGSKIFAKGFLRRHRIPTSEVYGVYDSAAAARTALDFVKWPLVLKADGLCAGKGVLVTGSHDEATNFIERALEKQEFGAGGAQLLLEEALTGPEVSFIVLCDGEHFVSLVPTRDHKRVFDGDRGPNTGGMGAYSSEEILSSKAEREILDTIVQPTMAGLKSDGHVYRGFLYFGLMLTAEGPKVLEFNCRLGDPETQALVRRMDFDLAEALDYASRGRLDEAGIKWAPGASLCVVLASGGYPGKFAVDEEIGGLDRATLLPAVAIFHAGTKSNDHKYYTCSGRVLGVTAAGTTLEEARRLAYAAVRSIAFSGAHYRADIGGGAVTAAATTTPTR